MVFLRPMFSVETLKDHFFLIENMGIYSIQHSKDKHKFLTFLSQIFGCGTVSHWVRICGQSGKIE